MHHFIIFIKISVMIAVQAHVTNLCPKPRCLLDFPWVQQGKSALAVEAPKIFILNRPRASLTQNSLPKNMSRLCIYQRTSYAEQWQPSPLKNIDL